jgi:hypothetical protein
VQIAGDGKELKDLGSNHGGGGSSGGSNGRCQRCIPLSGSFDFDNQTRVNQMTTMMTTEGEIMKNVLDDALMQEEGALDNNNNQSQGNRITWFNAKTCRVDEEGSIRL